MNREIEEKTCKDCLHYEVCRFVNALAVASVVNAENCRMFKSAKSYRKSTDVARKVGELIKAEIYLTLRAYCNHDAIFEIDKRIDDAVKKYESEGAE